MSDCATTPLAVMLEVEGIGNFLQQNHNNLSVLGIKSVWATVLQRHSLLNLATNDGWSGGTPSHHRVGLEFAFGFGRLEFEGALRFRCPPAICLQHIQPCTAFFHKQGWPQSQSEYKNLSTTVSRASKDSQGQRISGSFGAHLEE